MKALLLRSPLLVMLGCSFLMACSGNGTRGGDGANVTGGGGAGTDGGGGAADTCDPNAEIPCFKGLAEPCKDLHTTFDGDEYCLAVPDPDVGMQMHVGPDDYTDPEQTAKYMIAPGEETNWYEVKQLTNDVTKFTRGYHSSMRPGSHHFIMYGVADTSATGPVSTGSGIESANGIGGEFLAGATRATQNIDTKGEYPEDQGIGAEMPPRRSVSNNLHFINLGDHPLLQELWVNFIFIDEAEVTKYVKPITWYGGLAMNIPPGDHVVLKNDPASCTAPGDVRVAMMTAHAHASTLRVTTKMQAAGAAEQTTLFEDYNWHEPTEWRFNRAAKNPLPDAAAGTSGGFSGVVNTKVGDQYSWECEVLNKQTVNLTFGNHLLTGEMCNVFGFYFTDNRAAKPWTCAFF
jgi:hypothetical protein